MSTTFGAVKTQKLAGSPRLIESSFPYVAISQLVEADRRGRDPVYGVHKWFARRPPTLVRALLLASAMSADASLETFWERHATPNKWLEGNIVYDPFMGGGTSLVESARMGASVVGRDVDPIAVAVVNSELHGPNADFAEKADSLVATLADHYGSYFRGSDANWTPLHWFWLSRPVCSCGEEGLLYKDLIIATSSGRHGSVVRDHAMHVFCPLCLKVQAVGPGRKVVECCERRHKIAQGTFTKGRYHCAACGKASTHEDLQTGQAERVMVAVEETRPGVRRRIRTATDYDRGLVTKAQKSINKVGRDFDFTLETDRRDRRPVSAGYTTTRSLFTPRQWSVLTSAFASVRASKYPTGLERELTLMLTGALSSNNVLCGYARDWGRLAPLFSVRGFSLPALSVELNPFHPTGGRGTFRSARARMTERNDATVRRGRLIDSKVERVSFDLPVSASAIDIECRSATDLTGQVDKLATVCVTDPPYFDYIAYSELSEFFRAWLPRPELAGTPLLPDRVSPVESFAWGLGDALKATLTRLEPGTPLVFTYHSANQDAWTAIGHAFDRADLSVVALWPVLADPHMGHHAAESNCEWDVVVVARRKSEVLSAARHAAEDPTETWISEIESSKHFVVGSGDRASFAHAWAMGRSRFAVLNDANVNDLIDNVATARSRSAS